MSTMDEDQFGDEAGTSYDSDIQSEVYDYNDYFDDVHEHHEVHEMHYDVQQSYVVDSKTEYTGERDSISYA